MLAQLHKDEKSPSVLKARVGESLVLHGALVSAAEIPFVSHAHTNTYMYTIKRSFMEIHLF